MTPKPIALALLFTLGCAGRTPGPASPAAAASRVETRYDPATDTTLVRIAPRPPAAGQPGLFAGATYAGRTPARPPEQVLLGFERHGSSWRYEGCRELVLLTEAGQLAEAPLTRDTQIGSGGLTEFVTASFPLATLTSFAAAASPAVRLCQDLVPVAGEELAALRELLERLRSAPSAGAR